LYDASSIGLLAAVIVAPGVAAGMQRMIPRYTLATIGHFAGNAGLTHFATSRMDSHYQQRGNMKRIVVQRKRKKRKNAGRRIDPSMLLHSATSCPICTGFITAVLSHLFPSGLAKPEQTKENVVVPFRVLPTNRN
jgi:hypothetical protein